MIKAMSLNAEGVPNENNVREFSEKLWTDMQYQFGDRLRWTRIKDEKPKKNPKVEDIKKIIKKQKKKTNIE